MDYFNLVRVSQILPLHGLSNDREKENNDISGSQFHSGDFSYE